MTLIRGLISLAGGTLFAMLLRWRWDHEMVRVYDWWPMPETLFWAVLVLFTGFVCVMWERDVRYRRAETEFREQRRRVKERIAESRS